MTLGQRIKQARLEKGFTQKELSEKLGLSETYVSQYERDMRNPKPESLKRIADALDIPVSALDERLSTWDDLVRVAGGWMSSKEAALAADISADELSLICAYRQASLADKQIIGNCLDTPSLNHRQWAVPEERGESLHKDFFLAFWPCRYKT